MLTPLPHSVFPSGDIAEAFHLMQHSGHVGKIVVHPPAADSRPRGTAPFEVEPRRHACDHRRRSVVSGWKPRNGWWRGVPGTWCWSAAGAGDRGGQSRGRRLTRGGAQVLAEACDVSDRRAVERLFQTIAASMPPVVGVLHAAMVLEDALLANLDRPRFERVVAPKVRGVDNLDAVTRGMPLDYFVLFSSATTLMGNPGQANYVAANAYMEGVARRRRQRGRRHLRSVGGRSPMLACSRARSGCAPFPEADRRPRHARAEALDLMGQALALPASPRACGDDDFADRTAFSAPTGLLCSKSPTLRESCSQG